MCVRISVTDTRKRIRQHARACTPTQVRMLGRQAADVANISAIGRQKPADGEPGAGVKKKFIEGITFPFTVWSNINMYMYTDMYVCMYV